MASRFNPKTQRWEPTRHPHGDFAEAIGVCRVCGCHSCICKEAAREAELRADYVAQLEELDGERYRAQEALAAIRDLPSEHDLMHNATVRAMYALAIRGLGEAA